VQHAIELDKVLIRVEVLDFEEVGGAKTGHYRSAQEKPKDRRGIPSLKCQRADCGFNRSD
jgi:hypothetical protein